MSGQSRNAGASQAKGLIYQQVGDRPATPVRKGTKGPPAGAVHAAVPFAVADIPGDVYPADFHLVDKRKQEVAGKAGADGFDSSVYLTNRHNNAQNMAESRQRNYSGGGAPYAVHDVDGAAMYATRAGGSFHLQDNSKALPEKIGANASFDPEVYRQSITEHYMQQQVSKQRNGGASAEGASGSGCPYATGDSEELRQQWQRADYHAKVPGKQWADKVGAERTFDAAVYSNSLTTNRQRQADSTQRNFVGGGDILAFHPSS